MRIGPVRSSGLAAGGRAAVMTLTLNPATYPRFDAWAKQCIAV